MRRTAVDPTSLAGDDLERWYRRSPEEVEAARSAVRKLAHDEFVSGIAADESAHAPGSVQLARNTRGGRARVYVRPDTRSRRAVRGAEVEPLGPNFFHDFVPVPSPHLGDAYFPPLPSPLNRVERLAGGAYQIGDGHIVSRDEVDRIYAEQQRRISGEYGPKLRKPVPIEDRLPNGVVPTASQLKAKTHEADPTCHPYGGWEIDPGFAKYPKDAQDYEEHVTRSRGIDYVVRAPGMNPVKFDGCAVWSPWRELLEAKGPRYAALFAKAWRSTFGSLVSGGLTSQATRQRTVARDRNIVWHVAERAAMARMKDAVQGQSVWTVFDPPRSGR